MSPAEPSSEAQGYLRVMSILGHELRTPLTVIRGAATLILQAHHQLPPERTLELLRLVDDNSETMAERIEDLLTLSHLGAGDLRLNLQPTVLAEVVDPAAASARRLGHARLEIPDGVPDVRVIVDLERAVQALRALLSNAVRDAGRGGAVILQVREAEAEVTLELQLESREQQQRPREFAREVGTPSDLDSAPALNFFLAQGLARALGGGAGTGGAPGQPPGPWLSLRRDA